MFNKSLLPESQMLKSIEEYFYSKFGVQLRLILVPMDNNWKFVQVVFYDNHMHNKYNRIMQILFTVFNNIGIPTQFVIMFPNYKEITLEHIKDVIMRHILSILGVTYYYATELYDGNENFGVELKRAWGTKSDILPQDLVSRFNLATGITNFMNK